MSSGSIKRRPDGKWRARYRDPEGRERARHFTRKVDGERWLTEVASSMLRGEYVDPRAGRTTFREYADGWLASQVLRPTTMNNYEATLRRNVNPRIGDRPLASIRPSDIQAMVAWMSSTQELKPRTVRVAMAVTSSIFKAAVLDRRIVANPCTGVRLPEVHRARLEVLPVEHVAALHEAVADEWKVAVVLGASAGLRIGEVLGLSVDRIDFLRRQLVVDRQLMTLPKMDPYLAPPKTRASVRTIPLPRVTTEALAEHLRVYGRRDDGMLLPTVWRSEFSAKVWQPAVRRSGVPTKTSFHDLRHFYASLLIRHGESVRTVQARLGHSSAAMTLDVYSHLWPDSDDLTRAAVDDVLGGEFGPGADRDPNEAEG